MKTPLPRGRGAAYLVAQCAGAIAASLALRTMLGPVGSPGATVPTIATGAAFGLEWLLSFALMFVIRTWCRTEADQWNRY